MPRRACISCGGSLEPAHLYDWLDREPTVRVSCVACLDSSPDRDTSPLSPDEMRELLHRGGWSKMSFARLVGISDTSVARALNGRTQLAPALCGWLREMVARIEGTPPPPPPAHHRAEFEVEA